VERHDLAAAAQMLDSVRQRLAGQANPYHVRDYSVVFGELKLAQGQPDSAEPMLRSVVLELEREGGMGGPESIVLAQRDRHLYSVLAGLWLAQGRSPEDILSLWERYRLRVLGQKVFPCPDQGLTCLKPKLMAALQHLGHDQVLGQVALLDRLLLYRATDRGVTWTSLPIGQEQVLAAAARLEREASSPATRLEDVDHASRTVGSILLTQLQDDSTSGDSQLLHRQLFLEPDPLLGNLPWPSVSDDAGPIGLRFSLEESPSLILDRRSAGQGTQAKAPGQSLIVGASVADGNQLRLPEVLQEAKAVARFGANPLVLTADEATLAQVTDRLATASSIHFAGHATERDGAMHLLLAPQTTPHPQTGTDDAFIDIALLRRHPPRQARLAVFSACSTGKKQKGWDHGMGDIVSTLAALGVPDVVATRWQIDSSSAVSMMDSFYGGLAEGLSVPQSLTAARQALSRDARYRHPYYWAAYYSSGWGNSDLRPVFRKSQ